MKKYSKKGILLFAAMALCAFAMPSMASAASWTVVGTEHTLDSPNVGFEGTSPLLGTVTSQCTASSFTVTVTSASVVQIDAATFGGDCTAHGPGIGTCIATARATNLPWTATATTPSVQIHGIDIDVTFDTGAPGTCNFPGTSLRITGTINSGATVDNVRHELNLSSAGGLIGHAALGGATTLTANGTFRDTQQTLVLDS